MKINLTKLFKTSVQTQQGACPANQNRPECSLIEELREIQEELRLMSFNYDEREKIMLELIGSSFYSNHDRQYMSREYRIDRKPLFKFLSMGVCFKDTATLEFIISRLQKFKECVESEKIKEQRKEYLKSREREIKHQLGIN